MNITMLGTGNALVTECCNTCFVIDGKILIDASGGNWILSQLRHAGLTLQDIHSVFITHQHIDHLLGIIWVIRITAQQMLAGKYSHDLDIYSHNEVISLIEDIVPKLLLPHHAECVGKRIHLHAVNENETYTISGQEFTFFDIGSVRTKQFGFIMNYDSGKKLVCFGDESCHSQCEHYAQNADWMMHEAFCLYDDVEKFRPYEKFHGTVKDAALLAQRLNVKNLLLYHTEDSDLIHRKERYTSEARKYFGGNVYVPDDLEILSLL